MSWNKLSDKVAEWHTSVISLMIHIIFVGLFSGVILYKAVEEPPEFTSESGFLMEDSTKPEAPSQPLGVMPAMPNVAQMAPAASLSAISTTSPAPSTFQVPVPNINVSSSANQFVANSAQALQNASRSLGSLSGMGSQLGRGGGTEGFFGQRMNPNAKRVAILLDYSGSMGGEFRAAMEEELEKFLAQLPRKTEILIIPWAGPAWLYTELASQISKKWRKAGDFDDFELVRGANLDRPKWTPIEPEKVPKILTQMRAQVAMPGGTDWRQPFRYAMRANPPPDTIYFMTDGQIKNAAGALKDIEESLSKAHTKPELICMWIENKAYLPNTLKTLAEKNGGRFTTVGVGD